jgi:hypothetical protein
MTEEAAYEIVSKLPSTMARDLTSRPLNRLSHNQLVWLHVLANEATEPDHDPKEGTL